MPSTPSSMSSVFQPAIEGFTGLGSTKLRLRSHLTGFGSKVIKLIPSRAGDRLHLTHLRIEIRCGFHSRCAKAHDRCGHMGGEGFADTGDLVTGLLQLLPGLVDLLQRGIGGGNLGFQIFQGLFGLFNLPLQGIVFILPEGPVFQLLLCLLLRRFEGFQFILRRTDGFL